MALPAVIIPESSWCCSTPNLPWCSTDNSLKHEACVCANCGGTWTHMAVGHETHNVPEGTPLNTEWKDN